MKAEIYLYDAKGNDEKIELDDVDLKKLTENRLVWIDLQERDKDAIDRIADVLHIEYVPVKSILDVSERPKIDKFEGFFRFFICSVKIAKSGKIESVPIDFLVGKNFIVTIHDGEVDYFKEFLAREKGETQMGELDAESFVAALLDLHIVSYFRALEQIEVHVDNFDETILKVNLETEKFLTEIVKLNRDVSKLRRWFLPHRDVFYAFSRPDFTQISESDSVEHFKMLNMHFDHAIDAIESARDTVLSVFELYATKSTHLTNVFIKRLTFLTVTVGMLAVIAGVLGMNFKMDFFDSPYGFWVAIAGMVLLAMGLTIAAKLKRWI